MLTAVMDRLVTPCPCSCHASAHSIPNIMLYNLVHAALAAAMLLVMQCHLLALCRPPWCTSWMMMLGDLLQALPKGSALSLQVAMLLLMPA